MTRGNWTIDKKELCNRLCISPEFFDLHFKKDPRIRAYEIKRGKSWWITEKVKDAAIEIMVELSN
ncbi:hypothetical protein [Macrococcoides canis]|uniref:hypothetical protein n=1 Tax=Macrococcoides canis TaxID=1855823 RepID=UPI0020B7DAAC|nr:hypothetical protein [Macrococcus canis]UTH10944.1 hypothetical protein KFV10_08480 [Macrococcus canis]